MKHLTEADAVDLVRDVVDRATRRWMERHLAEGCAPCGRTVALFQRVAATAQVDTTWDVPADVMERAVDIFPDRPARSARPARRLVARLIFDSFRAPLPAGVRATGSVSRQVLYRAGSYFIDLRLDAAAPAARVSVVGQVVQRGSDGGRAASVALVEGRTVSSYTPVNPFGEFHVEYDPGGRVRLRVLLDGGEAAVDLPLSRLLPVSEA